MLDLDAGDPAAHSLRTALDEANIPTLVLVLTQLTGDDRWLKSPYAPRRGRGLSDNDSGGLPEEIHREIRDATYDAVIAVREGRLTPRMPSPDEVALMLGVALAEEVPEAYGPLLSEELGFVSRDVRTPPGPPENDFRVVIVGAGISGLCAAIKLKAAGIAHTVVEKNDDIGGTWLENTYPGCGVDTPSHLYSFSFALSSEWPRYFAKREHVWGYLRSLADEYRLTENIRFGTEVVRADWDGDDSLWRVQVRYADGSAETLTGNVLVPAVGMVNRPSVPPIEGLDCFDGPIMHTAQWRSDVDLAGKRVAVVGTGASAMQLVPSIVDQAQRVIVFQRSKQWAIPHPNYQREVSPSVRRLMREVPTYAAWYRLRAFWNFSDRLHAQLQIDPQWPHPERSINEVNESHRIFLTKYIASELGERADLLEACLPDYPPYGKRPLIDNGWYRAICRDDVDLVTDAVDRAGPDRVVTRSGAEFEADVIILATGFKTLQFLWPMEIRGRYGRTLREVWGHDDARAHLGLTVPEFPNMFILNGPNTNAGHGGSAVIATEFQVRYLMQALGWMIENDYGSVEIREDVFWDYNNDLDKALSHSVWVHPGMTTYYRNEAGRVVISSPWKYLDYWGRTLEFSPDHYVVGKSTSH